jgi:hypothetical protein
MPQSVHSMNLHCRYYETCTRHTPDRLALHSHYWCPSQDSLDEMLSWTGVNLTMSTPLYGICPDFVMPPDNGCDDHYEPVRNFVFFLNDITIPYLT